MAATTAWCSPSECSALVSRAMLAIRTQASSASRLAISASTIWRRTPEWPRDAGDSLAANDWHSAAALVAIPFLPDSYTARMSTIENHEGDESASTRVEVWRWTLEYVQDHPFGGGFDAYRSNKFTYKTRVTTDTGGVTQSEPRLHVVREQGVALGRRMDDVQVRPGIRDQRHVELARHRLERQVRMDCLGAIACEQLEMVDFARLAELLRARGYLHVTAEWEGEMRIDPPRGKR